MGTSINDVRRFLMIFNPPYQPCHQKYAFLQVKVLRNPWVKCYHLNYFLEVLFSIKKKILCKVFMLNLVFSKVFRGNLQSRETKLIQDVSCDFSHSLEWTVFLEKGCSHCPTACSTAAQNQRTRLSKYPRACC